MAQVLRAFTYDIHPWAPECTSELFFFSFIVNHIGIFLKIQGSEFMRLSGDIIVYFKKKGCFQSVEKM